jgi:hypothetical protein
VAVAEASSVSLLPDLKSISHPEPFQSVMWWPGNPQAVLLDLW